MNIIEIPILSSDITLEQWLTYWFDAYMIRNLKRSTAVAYLGYINNHIVPKIGKYKLSELNTNILQAFFNSEADNGSARGGGLSPKSLQNIKRMLHKALEKAVETELISKNYSNYVDIPAVIPPEMIVLTVKEHKRLIGTLMSSEDPLDFGIFLSVSLGLRLGEVLGLQWGDIDRRNNTVNIRRTVNRLAVINGGKRKTEIVIGTPKTKSSKRSIPVTEDFLKYFDIYASKFPCRKDSGDFLFKSSKKSKPCEPKTMQKHFKATLKELKIKGPTFHSLRHTFATRAIEKNVNVKTLSALLGHADVSITQNIYSHLIQEAQNRNAEIIGSAMFKKKTTINQSENGSSKKVI